MSRAAPLCAEPSQGSAKATEDLRRTSPTELLSELTEERWAHIQARLRATGVPVEAEDDRALARTVGISGVAGAAITALVACGIWALLS